MLSVQSYNRGQGWGLFFLALFLSAVAEPPARNADCSDNSHWLCSVWCAQDSNLHWPQRPHTFTLTFLGCFTLGFTAPDGPNPGQHPAISMNLPIGAHPTC